MAEPKENSLCLGRGIDRKINFFIKQRECSRNNSILVLQHLEELKKRELAAKLHNRQLLHQFEEAQDTLRSMLTLTASMRTIRREYERHLENERFPLRHQQLWEKRTAAQKKKSRCEVVTARADQMMTSQVFGNQDGLSNLTYTQSPCLSSLHQLRSPVSVPSQPYQLQQLASLTRQNDKAWLSQNAPDQTSLQVDLPWSWLAGNQYVTGAIWEQTNMVNASVEEAELQAETSEESSSKTERCSSRSLSSHFISQELDDKPVRLSNTPAESSREASHLSSNGKKKKKKEKIASSCNSSNRKGSISQSSSKTSSVTITVVPCKVSKKSDSSISSEEGFGRSTARRIKSGHVTEIERKRAPINKNKKEVEEQEVQYKSNKDRERKEVEEEEEKRKSSSENMKNIAVDLSSSSEEEDETDEEKHKPPREGVEDCVNVDSREEMRGKLENEETLERRNSTDEEEMKQEEEMEEQESDEEDDQVEQAESLSDDGKDSPQGEKESDAGEGKVVERGESDQEGDGSEGSEEPNGESDQAEEESNSDDIIVPPQRRSKELHSTIEDEVKYHEEEVNDDDDDDDDDGGTSGTSEESSDEDDIEQLLAPQEQLEEKPEEVEETETTKAFCNVQSFRVKEVDSAKADDPRDSDEYDDFYN